MKNNLLKVSLTINGIIGTCILIPTILYIMGIHIIPHVELLYIHETKNCTHTVSNTYNASDIQGIMYTLSKYVELILNRQNNVKLNRSRWNFLETIDFMEFFGIRKNYRLPKNSLYTSQKKMQMVKFLYFNGNY